MAIALSADSDENNVAASTSSQISSENKKSSAEMIGGCSVCSDDQGTEENPLVYCDGCEVAVHQACYGIVQVPAGSWFCRKCESGETRGTIKCQLCPSLEGALKRTETGNWAHVVCALYIPEVRFGNINTMEPIEIRHIQVDRYNKSCYLCEENKSAAASFGAVMNCNKLGCKQSFHVTCAQSAGLLCEEAGHNSDNLNYCGYCKHHFRKIKPDSRKPGSSLNSSSSPGLDSASDSSQDADTRCNMNDQDKNPNRTEKPSAPPTDTALEIPAENQATPISHSTAIIKTNPVQNNNSIIAENATQNQPANSGSPKKRKKSTKNVQEEGNSSATTNKPLSLQPNSATISPADQTSSGALDVYRWSSEEQNDRCSLSGSTGKKKQLTNSIAKLSVSPPTVANNHSLAKIGSPNLSTTSSPSPSTSSKSTSNTSTTSSSTITPSSNSPSPALPSPNITSRASTVRLESALTSTQRAITSLTNKSSESVASNVSLPIGQTTLQTRINLDNPRKDIIPANSSLLSTAVPHEQMNNPLTSVSIPIAHSDRILPAPSTFEGSTILNSSEPKSLDHKTDTQPIVPPLIIPVPQTASLNNSAAPKATAKAKPAAKNSKKKVAQAQEPSTEPPKTKSARAKRGTQDNGVEVNNNTKTETKRGKAKSAAQKSDPSISTTSNDNSTNKAQTNQPTSPTKRKSRLSSNESSAAPTPAKRQRKKKSEQTGQANSNKSSNSQAPSSQAPSSVNSAPIGPNPLMINMPAINNRFISGLNTLDGQDIVSKYYSPLMSPYTTNFDTPNGPSFSRSSSSRVLSTSAGDANQTESEDPEKAFEELRENTWSHLSKCIIDQAQNFDIPSLVGTLYTLRSENEKLVNRVRDLTMRRDQLLAINARLDLPGPMLTQHLSNTSPNFSSVVSGLANSPKSIPTPSPGSSLNKQSLISVGHYNHLPPVTLNTPQFLDRSSPMMSQTHSGINNIKSSISTPSPPITLLAHNNSNRVGLNSVNSPYIPNVFPPVGTMAHGNNQSTSYYQHRQT